MISMHGQTTAQEIFRQLCGATEDAVLSWKRFAGITTDRAPMTGRNNGLVALVQRGLEGENVKEAIALHCIIHQQALCGKCDNVMSVVVKCINHIRSRGLKYRQSCAFLEETRQIMRMCSTSLMLAELGLQQLINKIDYYR